MYKAEIETYLSGSAPSMRKANSVSSNHLIRQIAVKGMDLRKVILSKVLISHLFERRTVY